MPKELRKLLYSIDETRAAVIDYCLRNNIHLPKANIEKIELRSKSDIMVYLEFAPEDDEDAVIIELTRDQVAAAIIRFSTTHRIPLPRRGKKMLQVEDDGVALMINIHWNNRKRGSKDEEGGDEPAVDGKQDKQDEQDKQDKQDE